MDHLRHERDSGAPTIVCIGLSAGGITPVMEIFRRVPETTGMTFVVIHHLRREHPTALVEILENCTRMPVQLADAALPLEPDHVYVLPSGDEIVLNDGAFSLRSRTKIMGWSNVISKFVSSMSRSRHRGIAVILSGMDADGAEELAQLKRHGGIVIAQIA